MSKYQRYQIYILVIFIPNYNRSLFVQKLLHFLAFHLLLSQMMFNFLAINLATSLLMALLLRQPSHLLLKCSVSSSSSFSSPFFLSTANQNELFMPEMLAHTRLHTATAATTTTTTVEGTSFARWILPSSLLSPPAWSPLEPQLSWAWGLDFSCIYGCIYFLISIVVVAFVALLFRFSSGVNFLCHDKIHNEYQNEYEYECECA